MRLIDFSLPRAEPITEFGSRLASAISLGSGSGEAHAYVVYLEPGGVIGPHVAGFGQLFLCVAGYGWVSGGDGVRHPITEGTGAYIASGDIHAKGSETGMTAIMVQVEHLTLSEDRRSHE